MGSCSTGTVGIGGRVDGSTSTNLAPNPGFETANSGWTEIPSTVFPATSIWRSGWGMATERTGQYGYAISNVGYGYKWTDPIPVTPGDELDVFAWMRGEIDPDDSAGSAGVRAYFYDSSGAYLSWAGVSIYPGSLDGAWELGGKSVTVPSGASTVRLMLISHSNSGWVAFDDAYLSDVSSNTSTTYYDVAGRRVAFRDSDGIQYLFSDHIGSATVSYRPSDGQTERQYYTPYGGIRHTDGLDTDIGYTGQRADTSTGLMFYNARYYDPAIGRFISPDTVVPDPANPQDYDRYAYVRNNPVNYSDPTGHCPSELQNVSVLCAEHDIEVHQDGFSLIGAQRVFRQQTTLREVGETASLIPGADVFVDPFLCGGSVASGSVGGSVLDCGAAFIPFVGVGAARAGWKWLKRLFNGATDDIVRVNGRLPINSSYAGRVYDGAGWTDDLAARYPDGVRFTDGGFPDFSPYARARVQFDDLTGTYASDAAAANRALNLSGTPSGYVWHHVEDGRTLILIPQDIHAAVRHTGGAAVIRGAG